MLNEGLVTIDKRVFKECRSLESIALPSTITDIGDAAFLGCDHLREVVLSEGLEKIGSQAFETCESLESITFPSSVIEIGSMAFKGCSGLSEVVCIEGLPKFEYNTFSYCPALETITFPNISTRLDNIIRAGQVDVQNKIQKYINQDIEIEWRRGGTICILVVEVTRRRFVDTKVARKGDRWNSVQQRLGRLSTGLSTMK